MSELLQNARGIKPPDEVAITDHRVRNSSVGRVSTL